MDRTREYRFFVSPELLQGAAAGSRITLSDETLAHQVRNVLRLRAGDRLTLLDGNNIARVKIEEGEQESKKGRSQKTSEHLLVESIERVPQKQGAAVAVAMPLIKPARFELALEKLTELGVDEILPFYCTRLVTKPDRGGESGARRARMQAILRESSEQCERLRLPVLHESRSFSDLLSTTENYHWKLLLAERSEAPNLVHLLCNREAEKPPAHERILILLGPEGGLTNEEKEAAQSLFQSVSLGSEILRSETAAIVASALVISHIMNKD